MLDQLHFKDLLQVDVEKNNIKQAKEECNDKIKRLYEKEIDFLHKQITRQKVYIENVEKDIKKLES